MGERLGRGRVQTNLGGGTVKYTSNVARILGEDTAQPLLMGLAIVSHLIYGGIWGAILLALTSRVALWKGIALGLFL